MSVYLGPLPRQLWNPWKLTPSLLKAWWSADDLAPGAVATWTDRIASIATTAAAGLQPIAAANSWPPNGKAGVTPDGVDDCFVNTSFAALPTGSTPGEIWTVATAAFSGNSQYVIRYGAGGGTATNRGIFHTNQNKASVSDGATFLNDTVIDYDNAGHIVGGYWSGTVQGGRIDGRDFTPATGTIATLATGTTRLRIAATNVTTAANNWGGILRHILVTALLTLAQRQLLEGWLAWDCWPRSSPYWPLPPGHPYRDAPP